MEARNNERMRIAQDLHDTLLQGLLSASFQLSLVQDQLPPKAKAAPASGTCSEPAATTGSGGRNAVRGLRTWNLDSDDLERAIGADPGRPADRVDGAVPRRHRRPAPAAPPGRSHGDLSHCARSHLELPCATRKRLSSR